MTSSPSPHPEDPATVSISASTRLNITISSPSPLSKYPSKQHCRRVSSLLLLAGHPTESPALIYLPGAPTTMQEDSDFSIQFRQRRYFSYLSGVTNDMPDCALAYNIQKDQLVLYIPNIDPKDVLWSGMPRGIEECLALYDVDDARYKAKCDGDLLKWVLEKTLAGLALSSPDRFWTRSGHEKENSGKHKSKSNQVPKPIIYCLNEQQIPECFKGTMKAANAASKEGDQNVDCRKTEETYVVNTTALKVCINEARTIKDIFEIELIKKAIDISCEGHKSLQKSLFSAKNEAELEGVFMKECISRNAKSQAYAPIICSGRNCATLHYTANDADLKGKQLVLIDAACEWNCYAADITRTWPIDGTFTKEAADIYKAVERMQIEAIKKSVAGVDWIDTHLLAHRIAIEELLKLGILRNGTVEEMLIAGISYAFFPHGLGHMIGLEVHDVEGLPDAHPLCSSFPKLTECIPRSSDKKISIPTTLLPRVLKPNMVITVEPGIYFSNWVTAPYLKDPNSAKYIDGKVLDRYWDVGGVRIEDIILINEEGKGNTVLSAHVPKAIVA